MPREDGRLVNEHQVFLEEMLMETQQSLAYARSVKEAKFIQNKITYLKQRLNSLKPNGHKKKVSKHSKGGK